MSISFSGSRLANQCPSVVLGPTPVRAAGGWRSRKFSGCSRVGEGEQVGTVSSRGAVTGREGRWVLQRVGGVH